MPSDHPLRELKYIFIFIHHWNSSRNR